MAKYCKEEHFLSIRASKSSSYGWKGVLIGSDLLINHLGWIVGTGEEINVWSDAWLSSTTQQRPIGPAPEALKDLKVSALMLANSTEWDIQKIDSILPFHKEEILHIKPSICSATVERVWLKSASGEHTAKSGYRAQAESRIITQIPAPETNHDWLANV